MIFILRTNKSKSNAGFAVFFVAEKLYKEHNINLNIGGKSQF